LNRQFLKEEIQIVNKYMKECSTSSVIKAMQIKVTLQFHLTPATMAIIRETTTNGDKATGCGKKKPLYMQVGI
jgi:hypothetical protein